MCNLGKNCYVKIKRELVDEYVDSHGRNIKVRLWPKNLSSLLSTSRDSGLTTRHVLCPSRETCDKGNQRWSGFRFQLLGSVLLVLLLSDLLSVVRVVHRLDVPGTGSGRPVVDGKTRPTTLFEVNGDGGTSSLLVRQTRPREVTSLGRKVYRIPMYPVSLCLSLGPSFYTGTLGRDSEDWTRLDPCRELDGLGAKVYTFHYYDYYGYGV